MLYARLRAECTNDPLTLKWLETTKSMGMLFERKQKPPTFSELTARMPDQETGGELTERLAQLTQPIESMIGLGNTKRQIRELINFMRLSILRERANLSSAPLSFHMAFMGNPGTGKTSVARHFGDIYHTLGITKKKILIEVDRTDLIGSKIGYTEDKTRDMFDRARGGILFIDEAHSLLQPDCPLDYGHECVATLAKLMEDSRGDTVVILAGYGSEMERTILGHKSMKSRINHKIIFDDYSPAETTRIFQKFCADNNYKPARQAVHKLSAYLETVNHDGLGQYANARDVRNIFEKSIIRQAQRLSKAKSPSAKVLQELRLGDIVLPITSQKGSVVYLKN